MPSASTEPEDRFFRGIAYALRCLGYAPLARLGDAASRMAQTPDMARDMMEYHQAGQPAIDYQARTPVSLFRPLPDGHTVASLCRDFELSVVGGFLLASELLVSPEEARETMRKATELGVWRTLEPGVRAHVYLPAAQGFPACPNCGARWTKNYPECPHCGYGPRQRAIDGESTLLDELERLEPSDPGEAERRGLAQELDLLTLLQDLEPDQTSASPELTPADEPVVPEERGGASESPEAAPAIPGPAVVDEPSERSEPAVEEVEAGVTVEPVGVPEESPGAQKTTPEQKETPDEAAADSDAKPDQTCGQCGSISSPGAKYCRQCGARLGPEAPAAPSPPADKASLCPKCAQPQRPGAKFCRRCGAQISTP